MKKTVGVLALQGCVLPHKKHIEALGDVFLPVKTSEELSLCDALILPGGESGSILKKLDYFQMWEELESFCQHKAVWGICAGAILMAKEVSELQQKSLGLLEYCIERNAYGRQLESFEAHLSEEDSYPVAFIRAPRISNYNKTDLSVLAVHGGSPTWLCRENKMSTTFHPELTRVYPSPVHQHFQKLYNL